MPPARANQVAAQPKSKSAKTTEDWRANKRRENPNFDQEQAEAAKQRRLRKKLEKEAALQDMKAASCLVAAAKKRTADASSYADTMQKSQGRGYVVGGPFLG